MSTSNSRQNLELKPDQVTAGSHPIITASQPLLSREAVLSTKYYHDIELTGIFPLFLTKQSQTLVKAIIEVNVTVQMMFRMVPKSDLIQDMATRLAISDFTPAKALILAYPREEMMLHYDPEYKYTQNFFLIIDPEIVDMILTPAPTEAENVVAVELSVADLIERSHTWQSLGSERDIEVEWVVVEISRKFADFGAPYAFENVDSFAEIKPFKDLNYDLNRMEVNIGVQAVPGFDTSESQTTWFRPINFGSQYKAIEMDSNEMLDIQASESLETFFFAISSHFEAYLQQNEIMDIFNDDYLLLGDEEMVIEAGSQIILQEYQSFTDLANSKESSISCIDWHPVLKGVVAVSCTQARGLDDRLLHGYTSRSRKSVIIIWSFHDPVNPQLVLEAPGDVTCFQINPVDPSIIVAGCMNGQVVLWDITDHQDKLQSIRKKETSVELIEKQETPLVKFAVVSSIESSHRAPLSEIRWSPSNFEIGSHGEVLEGGENGFNQFVTSSLDGSVAIWDLRFKKDWKSLDLVWRPFIRVPLNTLDCSADYSISRVCLKTLFAEPAVKEAVVVVDGKPKTPVSKLWTSKFYCGTEEGDLLIADWIAEKSTKEEKVSRVEVAIAAHHGPITDLERSPFFHDILLSTGGWSVNIWKEKLNSGPIFSSSQSTSSVNCGKWSPSRPAVFYLGRTDGMLEVWDLLDSSHTPVAIQNISSSALSSINVRQYAGKAGQQYIAVGDDSGTLHILETPRTLLKMIKSEKSLMASLFERESKRAAFAEERKGIHLKGRKAFEISKSEALAAMTAVKTGMGDGMVEVNQEDPAELKEEKEYMAMEDRLMNSGGLAPSA